MNTPKISIIVPAYNAAPFLEPCVRSILAQNYRDREVILVDDGSKDDTMAHIRRLVDEDARVIAVHQDNAGVTAARLNGIEHAHGEYIGFVDGDDFIEPEMYERLLANARKYQAEISHCGYQMIVGNRVDYYWNTGRLDEDDRQSSLEKLLRGEIEPGLCYKLFHRSLFERAALREKMPTDVKNNEDLLMNYWLFRSVGKVVFEDFCPYHYIVRHGSATSNPKTYVNRLLDPLKVMRIIAADATGNPALERLAHSRILGSLAGLSTLPTETDFQREVRRNARVELKKEYGQFFRCVSGRKQQLRITLARYCPCLCRWMIQLYSSLSGKGKRYVVTDDKGE